MVELTNTRLLDSFGCKCSAKAKLAVFYMLVILLDKQCAVKAGYKAQQKGNVGQHGRKKVPGAVVASTRQINATR